MRFFIENQRVEKEVDWVLNQLRLYMNGATTSQMEERGICYRKNYGVAIAHLKQLVNKIPVSYELAERLWFLEIRETMLLAALMVESDDMSQERCREWAAKVTNRDLIERSAMFLWQRVVNVDGLLHGWFIGNDVNLKATAFYTIGHRVQGGASTSFTINELLNVITNEETEIVLKAASFALRMLMRKKPQEINKIKFFIESRKASDRRIDKIMVQELVTEIDFLHP